MIAASEPHTTMPPATSEDAEVRHTQDRAWFLSNPALWLERQQQVVAVFDRTILGQGPNFGSAYEAARRQCAAMSKPCPDQYDMTFVVVPDMVESEAVVDCNPLEPGAA